MTRLALQGDLLDFTDTPALDDPDSAAVRYRPDHWLLLEGGRIAGVQALAPDATWRRESHRGRLILPGFVDTHVHSAQVDVIGAYGSQLLEVAGLQCVKTAAVPVHTLSHGANDEAGGEFFAIDGHPARPVAADGGALDGVCLEFHGLKR